MANNHVSKSFFAVLNNPRDHGYAGTPEDICEQMRSEWVRDSETRTGAWAYCIAESGLEHVHMVLEDTVSMRFEALKAEYAVGAHFEVTKGTKAQAEAYIRKDPPFDEKGERVLCIIRHGEIKGKQGHRSDLEEIEDLLKAGMTPEEILATKFRYYRHERMIRSAYAANCLANLPPLRDIKVHYITGEAGAGKSYHYVELCEKHGIGAVYRMNDYTTGGFDLYAGQRILFIDEFKAQLPYSTLLSLIDGYRTQVHARYANVVACWEEVYITSVYSIEMLHYLMVDRANQAVDSLAQLKRRITDITYCHRNPFGEYCRYTIPMSEYKGMEDLKQRAYAAAEAEQLRLSDV